MSTITLYHATNVSKSEIGIQKKTMYLTSNINLATAWGKEHFEEFDILSVDIPVSNVHVFKGFEGRERFINHDFEIMELPEMYANCEAYWNACGTDIIYHADSSDGYIIHDISKYELKYA